jgi:hypothetical protein
MASGVLAAYRRGISAIVWVGIDSKDASDSIINPSPL